MRLHRNLALGVINGLHEIFLNNVYADKAVEKLLKSNKRWGARDRAFVAETIYDIVRLKRLYAEITSASEPYSNDDLWKIFTAWAVINKINIPDWEEFKNPNFKAIIKAYNSLQETRKYRVSIPDWLDDLGVNELGEATWTKEMDAMNRQAQVVLRVNTLKTTKEDLKQILLKNNIETVFLDSYPDALVLKQRTNVFRTDAFKKGLFEVQDASSQLVAPFLQVKPGMRVVDACAGAGGKTLHLASLMKNKGQIIALDIYKNKLLELKKRAKRNGAFNIETRVIDSTKVIKKLHHSADAVLIDAPCSGLGVLKRNPDAKYKLKPEFIKELNKTQKIILHDYSKMVKPGGNLVYATCSILPSENQEQIKNFLASENGKDFTLINENTILAHKTGFDGFYMALLKKHQ